MFRLRSLLSGVLIAATAIVYPFFATESASAAATVTKTVVVHDINGAAVVGALVAFGYDDVTAPYRNWSFTANAVTDSQGVATITGLPQNAASAELNVQPATADNTNAAFWSYQNDAMNWNLSQDSTINVTMQAANFWLNAKSSTGGDVPLHTSVYFPEFYPTGEWFQGNLLRLGKMGFYMDPGLTNWGQQPFYIAPWNAASSPDSQSFSLTTFVNSIPTLLNPVTSATITSPGNVWTINLPVTTFKFQPVSPIDSTVQAGHRLEVDFPNGVNDRWFQFNLIDKLALPDGTFKMRMSPAYGRNDFAAAIYTAVVTNGGSSVAIYAGSSASGTPLSTDVGGGYSLPLALPNYSGDIVDAQGNPLVLQSNQFFMGTVFKQVGSNFQFYSNYQSWGHYAFKFDEAGTYKLQLHPINIPGYTSTDSLPITVTGTAPNFQVAYNNGTPSSNLVQNFTFSAPNLNLTLTSAGLAIPSNTAGNFSVQVMQLLNGNWQYTSMNASTSAANPRVSFNITTPGTYSVRVNPQGMSQYGFTVGSQFTVSNTSGSPVVSWPGQTDAAIMNVNFDVSPSNLKFNVSNPIGAGGLPQGWISVVRNLPSPGMWFGNIDINPLYPTVAAAALPDGQYQLTLNPPWNSPISGISSNYYYAVVTNSGANVVLYEGTSATGTPLTPTNGIYDIAASRSNISGRFVDSQGNGLGQVTVGGITSYSTVCVQQLALDGVNWNWLNCTNTASDGSFSVSAPTAGTYRVRLEPHGFKSVSVTNSNSFTVSAADLSGNVNHNLGNVVAHPVSILVVVTTAGTQTPVPNAQVEIRQGNQFVQWVGADVNGLAAIGLTSAGAYTFVVHPNGNNSAYLPKSYAITAIASGNTITASADGISPTNGTYILPFGSQTIHGLVTTPPSGAPIANSQVVATDEATNQDLWNYSTSTGLDGSWSMYLPAGKYKIRAQAPWGTSDYGNSDQIGDVTVDSNGLATLSGAASGLTTSAFNLALKSPYWAGTIFDPSGTNPMNNAHVCANFIISGAQTWNCAQTDQYGKWALAMPTGFTGVFDGNSDFQIAENQNAQYPMLDLRGALALTAAGIAAGGATGIKINLPKSNVSLTVTAGGTPAANTWVNVLNANGSAWLAAGGTGPNGVANFYIQDLSQGLKFQVDPAGNQTLQGNFSNTTKTFQTTAVDPSTGIYSATLALSTPNLFGTLVDPTASNAVVPYAWVDIYNQTTNMWMGGASTDANGNFAMSVPAASSGVDTYQLNTNPSYQSTSLGARHTYTLTIDSSNVITNFMDPNTSQAVPSTVDPTSQRTIYSLKLLAPTVLGVVKDSTGTTSVPNAWVNVRDSAGFWLPYGSNTGSTGNFGLPLPAGSGGTTYLIQANPSQASSDQAVSSACAVTVPVSGSPTGSCIQGGSAVLQLNQPNFTVTVTDSHGAPVSQANVGIGLGMWNTGTQTNSSGVATLFIDTATIMALNPSLSGDTSFWLNIDPPFGSSNLVRASCGSNQPGTPCAGNALPTWTVGTSFPNTSLNISLLGPNTSVTVKNPDGSQAAVGTWVNLFSFNSGNWNWLGASGTDLTGKANFFVDTSTATSFVLMIDPSWNLRGTYSGGSYTNNNTGYTWDQLTTTSFNLHAPNVVFTIKDSNSAANRNGWIGVQTLDQNNNVTGWIGGYGLDQNGTDAVFLPASGSFQILMNPGPGSAGVLTTCRVTTNETGTVSVIPACGFGSATVTYDTPTAKTIVVAQLASGNTSGRAMYGSNPVAGAIVTATDTTNSANQVTTATDANGDFSLQLDPSKLWNISVTPVNTPSDPVILKPTILSSRAPGALGDIVVTP